MNKNHHRPRSPKCSKCSKSTRANSSREFVPKLIGDAPATMRGFFFMASSKEFKHLVTTVLLKSQRWDVGKYTTKQTQKNHQSLSLLTVVFVPQKSGAFNRPNDTVFLQHDQRLEFGRETSRSAGNIIELVRWLFGAKELMTRGYNSPIFHSNLPLRFQKKSEKSMKSPMKYRHS